MTGCLLLFFSVLYASRYSIPQEPTTLVPSCEGTGHDTQKTPGISGPPTTSTEDLPNTERKDRYMLKDILVEDMEIDTCTATGDLFEEMRIHPSLLVCEDGNCCNMRSESSAQSSESPQTQGKNMDLLESYSHIELQKPSVNPSSTKEKLKTFFKMTL